MSMDAMKVKNKCERPWAMWSVMNESNEDTKDSVQVCTILHVAHVRVRRVILFIVHNRLNGNIESVLVVVHTFT